LEAYQGFPKILKLQSVLKNKLFMNVKTKLRLLSVVLAVLGILLILFTIYPIVDYEYTSRKRFPMLVSPLGVQERSIVYSNPLGSYKNLGSWSSEYKIIPIAESDNEKYLLSIPALRIKDAVVYVGGEDLSKSLIQYPGTARPGQYGNTVIFGHSVLPVFFNPKNYMSIFSTIPRLKKGDEIFVNNKDVTYKFKISEMFEVEPDNLDILDQKLNDSYLSLVTCVPPGHPLKPRRLVVRARLTEI
jgi:sortase A